jgi:hypothetical protein
MCRAYFSDRGQSLKTREWDLDAEHLRYPSEQQHSLQRFAERKEVVVHTNALERDVARVVAADRINACASASKRYLSR